MNYYKELVKISGIFGNEQECLEIFNNIRKKGIIRDPLSQDPNANFYKNES